MNMLYPLVAVILVSLISIIAVLPMLFKHKISNKTLLFLLSASVGVLLTTVFVDFLPELFEHDYSIKIPIFILAGFLIMFILEKFVHSHHKHSHDHDNHNHGDCDHSHDVEEHAHGHAYHLAAVNLLGDGIHNFMDGLVIAGSFAINVGVGIAATISIIIHEVPQEIADFGVLLYSGMSKKKALIFNLLSALTAIIGAIVGVVLSTRIEGFTEFMLAFASGSFIYIAASNLVPQLHRHCGLRDTLMHIFAIVLGITVIVLLSVYWPIHGH